MKKAKFVWVVAAVVMAMALIVGSAGFIFAQTPNSVGSGGIYYAAYSLKTGALRIMKSSTDYDSKIEGCISWNQNPTKFKTRMVYTTLTDNTNKVVGPFTAASDGIVTAWASNDSGSVNLPGYLEVYIGTSQIAAQKIDAFEGEGSITFGVKSGETWSVKMPAYCVGFSVSWLPLSP